MRKLIFLCAIALCAETKVKLESLPAAVQATVKAQTQNAKLMSLSKETEGGKTMYEVETMVNGKSRDLVVDQGGSVVETEEEVAIESIPAAARQAIQKKADGNKIKKVEMVIRGSATSYEASIVNRLGKTSEVGVNADGSVHR